MTSWWSAKYITLLAWNIDFYFVIILAHLSPNRKGDFSPCRITISIFTMKIYVNVGMVYTWLMFKLYIVSLIIIQWQQRRILQWFTNLRPLPYAPMLLFLTGEYSAVIWMREQQIKKSWKYFRIRIDPFHTQRDQN